MKFFVKQSEFLAKNSSFLDFQKYGLQIFWKHKKIETIFLGFCNPTENSDCTVSDETTCMDDLETESESEQSYDDQYSYC